MQTLTLEIFPVGNMCNLNCDYCSTSFLSQFNNNKEIISQSILESIFHQIAQIKVETIQIHWSGGEPLLAGIQFYKKALNLEKRYIKETNVYNTMNTNGLLLNREYLEFFKKFNISVAVSIDGCSYIHNSYRFTTNRIFKQLLEKFDLFLNINYPLWIQMVVNHKNYKDAKTIFAFFKNLGISALSIYPAFHKYNESLTSLTISNEEYYTFLKEMFVIWVKNKTPFKVSLFNNLLSSIKYHKFNLCYLFGKCSSMNIDNSGNVYDSCIHQNQETFLGNILTNNFSDFYQKHLQRSKKGLNNTELMKIMENDWVTDNYTKSKACFQFDYRGSFYYMNTFWNLHNYIKTIGNW